MKNIIIIPDRIFHKIWKTACACDSFSEFYFSITDSESSYYINLFKYGFDFPMIYDTLSLVFEKANLDINDILKICNMSKAALSHRFCIPIRTVENWCNGSGKCASYILLMIFECFNIKYLPDRVYSESLYSKRSTSSIRTSNKSSEVATDSHIDNKNSNKVLYDDAYFDKIDKELDNIDIDHFSIRDFEATHLVDNKKFLDETDYLKKHMKK